MTQHHAPLQVQTSEDFALAIISRDGPPLPVDSFPRGPIPDSEEVCDYELDDRHNGADEIDLSKRTKKINKK
jgi:hypothetical protein